MKLFHFLFAGLLVMAACDSQNKSSSYAVAEEENDKKFDTRKEENEADFVADAIQDRYAEIKFAELVSTKSSDKRIQDFAQDLVNDQSKVLAELQQLANEKSITIPVDEGNATKEKVNKLFEADDADFDKQWCNELSSEHKKSIREYERMLEKTDDPKLKDIVNQALISLRTSLGKLEHLENEVL
jgi:putative membrane protein